MHIARGTRQTFGDCQGRRPLLPKNIETYGAITVDVGVVDLRSEADFGGLAEK
jgi:hypothetical protein